MKKLIIIRAARTDWDEHDRLVGDTDLSLSESGREEMKAVAVEIAGLAPKALYTGTDSPAQESAQIVAAATRLKMKSAEELREFDLGLWGGLTSEQFRERYQKVFKVWKDDPDSVEPPEGESLPALEERLLQVLRKIVRRKVGSPIAIVVGRFAFAKLRCRAEPAPDTTIWTHIDSPSDWFETDEATFASSDAESVDT